MSHLIGHFYPTRNGHRVFVVIYSVVWAWHFYYGFLDADRY